MSSHFPRTRQAAANVAELRELDRLLRLASERQASRRLRPVVGKPDSLEKTVIVPPRPRPRTKPR
jgi:hypothetical protein